MKRVGNLMHKVAELDNLYLAFWKAKRGKKDKKYVMDFELNLTINLKDLQAGLLSGRPSIGDYHFFKIYDPKERLICASAFRERVMQHAIMNLCHPIFERYQIYDSYACRKEKGTYKALDRASYFATQYRYFAKLDVRKYFETIDHGILKKQLVRLFKDQELLDIFFQIIDSYGTSLGKGLPIGNLTSQYFANHFLVVADHFVKEELGIKGYLRYMDDMVLFGNDLTVLNKQVRHFEDFLEKKLHCELRPTVTQPIVKGLPFLGYVIRPYLLSLAKRSRKRFKRKIGICYQELESGLISQEQFQHKTQAMIAFTAHANSYSFRKSVILKLEESQGY